MYVTSGAEHTSSASWNLCNESKRERRQRSETFVLSSSEQRYTWSVLYLTWTRARITCTVEPSFLIRGDRANPTERWVRSRGSRKPCFRVYGHV